MAPEKAIAALLLLASLVALVGAQSSMNGKIGRGSIITATRNGNAAWFSNSGKFAFGFYPEPEGNGFAIGIQYFVNSFSTVIWTADRDRQPIPANATLFFGDEGLVLHVEEGEGDRAISNLYDATLQLASATMHDDGNFVVYKEYNLIFWQTFDYPTDTLMVSQFFFLGNSLISSVSEKNHSSGRFQFSMQRDGKAVLYPVNTPETKTHAYWTFANESKYGLVLDQNGNLSILTASSSLNSSQHFLRIDSDGYLRIYSINQVGLMTVSEQYPSEENKCFIKGTCGLNSFCKSTGKDGVSCSCLPGYVYINASNVFAGCQRNFTKRSCDEVGSTTSNSIFYNMSRLPNVTWSNDSYGGLTVKSEDECGVACLRDCECFAALFLSSTNRCSKQRHPFQYGRALFAQDNSTVAFLKVVPAEQEYKLSVKGVGMGSLSMLGTVPLVSSLLVTAVFAVAIDFLIFFLCRYRIGMYRRLCESMETGLAKAMAPRFFSYGQLEEATGGYKEEIGQGRYGRVFKGLLPPRGDAGTPIAVKKLISVPGKIEENFRNELKSIGRLHHRNLVRLLGFCHEGSEWILVYEYMSRGSLADLIFKPCETPLSWKQRVGIAIDVATGLCHLHEGCDVAIIHGDIKPENVLIGGDYRAKIGDLGLAKHLQPGKQVTYTRSRGTVNYKAPDWDNPYDSVSPKVDVVSFGVLLLELIWLKKYFQLQGLDGESNLASWSYKCLVGRSEWQFPGEDVDARELEEMVKVALWCLHGSPEKRPSMFDVVMMLRRKKVVRFPPVPLVDWNVRADAGAGPMAGVEMVEKPHGSIHMDNRS